MKNTINEDLLIQAYMSPSEMISKEILWENHQVEEGARKYKELMEDKTLDETTGGMRLLKSVIHNTIEGMSTAYEEVDQMMNSTAGHKTQSWLYILPLVTAEQASIIAVNKILSYCGLPNRYENGYTILCREVAEALRTQVKYENWKVQSKEENKGKLDKKGKPFRQSPAQMLIAQNKGHINRNKLARWEKKFDNYVDIVWSEEDLMNVGAKVISVVCLASPDIFNFNQHTQKGKTLRTVGLTESAWKMYSDTEEFAEVQRPFLLPTLIKPVPYRYEGNHIEGGYHFIQTPFFSRGIHAHTSGVPQSASQDLLDSVNTIQNTAWKINPFILAVLEMVYGTGAEVKGVGYACRRALPDRISKEAFAELSKEDKISFKAKLKETEGTIASERGQHSAFTRKLMIAHKLSPHAEFFYPHFADWRGRLYPVPSELTPQGDKVSKALLLFANGMALGDTGLRRLKIHAANTYGMDKESLDVREQWATDNLLMMSETSSNPLTQRAWMEAEEPFNFLAVAKELAEATQLDDPSQFVSYIATAWDGTINGQQILSMIGRDLKGAMATNCTANNDRQDLYSEVATIVIGILGTNASSCAISAEWYALLKDDARKARDVVKQPVMTTCYGVTRKGIEDQLLNNKHCNGFTSGTAVDVSKVLTLVILEAMRSVNGKAVEIMDYFQAVSVALCEANLPMQWVTPNGLKVTQAYWQTNDRRVQTVFGEIRLEKEDKDLGLIPMRTANGSSPNIIHSFDAAMLQMTVTKLAKKGHESFAMIHDSYGMHAGNAEELNVALREVALDIFGKDVMADLHRQLQANTNIKLPMPPRLGDYDINEILNAEYFFS